MMNYIKVVNVTAPEDSDGRLQVELLVGQQHGPALLAKKVTIPLGTSVELGPEFWAEDVTPALGVSVSDGVGTKDRFGG